jgi:ribonuclease HII
MSLVKFTLEPDVTGQAVLGYEEANNPEWFEEHAGLDESGKGDLFGPVVSACVIATGEMTREWIELGIKDSKKLSEKKRKIVADYIKQNAIAWGIGEATVEEIDSMNILQASLLAMHRALDVVYGTHPFQHILADGPHFKPYFQDKADGSGRKFIANTCVLQGDATYMNIAAASILAKCYRDDAVCKHVADNPELEKYGFAQHKGYGTKKHLDALKTHGVTPHHRKSFGPVAALVRTSNTE